MANGSHMRKHIVIVGAGFAGLAAALELERLRKSNDRYNVTLVDKFSYHTYHALLYEVATAREMLSDADREAIASGVAVQLKTLHHIKLKQPINFVQGLVSRVDLANHQLEFADQPPLHFDHAILALGSESNDFGIPGLADHSLSLKELPDALAIHGRLHHLLGQCETSKQPIDIVIGGGGISGVETAGELRHYILRRCRAGGHDPNLARVRLLEASPTLLPGFPSWVQQAALNRLTQLGVEVRTNQPITHVAAQAVTLKDGTTIPASVFVWCGGIKAHTVMRSLGVTCSGAKQQVCVNPFLQAEHHEQVYVVGDSMYFVDPTTERPVPQVAPLAIAQGRLAAQNILRQIDGHPLKPYRPLHQGFVFPVGGEWAISTLWGLSLTGYPAWLVRKLVDLHYFWSILRPMDALRVFWKGGRVYMQND